VAGSDYNAKPLTTLSFGAGDTTKTVSVAVKADTVDEPDETVLLDLSSPVGVPIGDGRGVGTIVDDDPTPVTPAVSVDDVSITEGAYNPLSQGKTLTFTLRLSAPAPGTISVQYQTADGTAVQPIDYRAKPPTTLSFSKGQTSKTVSVTIKGDSTPEPDEFFFLLLGSPVGMTIADGSAAGFIRNDD
ncbi:MAG TPA: Calx-beta domain-containing protein, partial [Acidimicrobiales bacterium]|nr:Calx-beta domain-containing protein [Acidimicrobiales bacterium]